MAARMGRVDGERVLEELLAEEELPVRVLRPTGHHLLVGKPVGVLEQMQTCHPPGGNGRAAIAWAVHRVEILGHRLPGDDLRQPSQFMVQIDQEFEAGPDQRLLPARALFFRRHRYSRFPGVPLSFWRTGYEFVPKFL